jgi:DNA repair protein RadA/Sms
MRSRVTTVFACQGCGAVSSKWLGRCPDCGEWNSYVEELTGEGRTAAVETRAAPISEAAAEPEERTSTTLPGFDRVLGGGLVPGSLVLLGGEPGIGKSTLLLQAGRGVARSREVLYATGEESAGQVRLRGERLGIREEKLVVAAETDVSRIVALAEKRAPALLVVDSIQAVRDAVLTSAAGTVSQVRESALVLQRFAKLSGVPVILIGHVTKDGSLAGPKSLEHLVDAVVSIEGERGGMRRILRATKNRFGPVDELALYEMTGEGLSEIANASAALLSERRAGQPGSAVTAAREGSRSLLIEVQALVGPAASGSPRRVAIGLDGARLALLLAVLEGAGLPLSTREVFVSCTGGLEVGEPAADLAVVAALVSSSRGKPLPEGAVFFGEIGLLGEVRRVPAADARLKEAAALGFSAVYLPAGNASEAAAFRDLTVWPIDRVSEFLRTLFPPSGAKESFPGSR